MKKNMTSAMSNSHLHMKTLLINVIKQITGYSK